MGSNCRRQTDRTNSAGRGPEPGLAAAPVAPIGTALERPHRSAIARADRLSNFSMEARRARLLLRHFFHSWRTGSSRYPPISNYFSPL